jgi:ribonuclease HI
MVEKVTIYTDGSSRGNPGPGGYGVLLLYGEHRRELSKGFHLTTNNRMEVMAVIEGLKALKKKGLHVTIFSDSQYVVKAVKEGWLKKWMATNFKGGKKNQDLWREFHQLIQEHQVDFKWVKGHADNPFNNRCDELATAAADGHHRVHDHVYENEISS